MMSAIFEINGIKKKSPLKNNLKANPGILKKYLKIDFVQNISSMIYCQTKSIILIERFYKRYLKYSL
jgi:hypothetical protein